MTAFMKTSVQWVERLLKKCICLAKMVSIQEGQAWPQERLGHCYGMAGKAADSNGADWIPSCSTPNTATCSHTLTSSGRCLKSLGLN